LVLFELTKKADLPTSFAAPNVVIFNKILLIIYCIKSLRTNQKMGSHNLCLV
jgi:hypothetical protein